MAKEIQNPSFQIQLVYQPAMNAAMLHNHVPAIKEVSIEASNDADTNHGYIFTLENSLGAWPKWSVEIETLIPHVPYQLKDIPCRMDWESLSGLTERMDGIITAKLFRQSDKQVCLEQCWPLSLMPLDQWLGVQVLPELVSAFVTPNIPAVQQILQSATVELQRLTADPSLDDYQQQDVNRVRNMMAAIYASIRQLNIVYATVPPSFEQQGQRVRMPDGVMKQRMGNCLDMSLLFASCLEAAGLNPILVVVKGHAFVGGWLIQETLADPISDDPSVLSKRMAEGIYEIALIEATAMNAGKGFGFEQAEQLAAANLAKTDDFILCVDIKRARYGGVLPLPLRVQNGAEWNWVATNMPYAQAENDENPGDIKQGDRIRYGEKMPIGRQQIWERKLLDLSLRNALLNMRISQQTLQLITPPLAELEDMLAAGAEITILPRPTDWDGQLRQSGLYEALHATDPILQLVSQELKHKRIRCYQDEVNFHDVLTAMYRKAKTAMEENGANTLFLAIGVLRWYETPQSQRPRFAPLILTPVEIVRRGAQKGFVIRSREEESQINITLFEMLRQDFGITISGLDPLPRDENGVDVKQILHVVRQLVMSQPRWYVEAQALIGHFSFNKFVMWRDLHENAHLLARNSVVESLLKNQLCFTPSEIVEPEPSPDSRWKLTDVLLPIGADSSQLKAIAAALEEESFVLHGPPGTGKSQTITNIIANALYRGKRVLFVAEKMAALEVVEKRLESIGLGPYCLELHSNKARKSEVLEQLKQVLEVNREQESGLFMQEAARLEELRTELNQYIDALHRLGPFGISLFEALQGFLGLGENVCVAPVGSQMLQSTSAVTMQVIEEKANALQAAAMALNKVHQHPLQPVLVEAYSKQLEAEASQVLHNLVDLLKGLQEKSGKLKQSFAFLENEIVSKEQWVQVNHLMGVWTKVPDFPVALWLANEPQNTWERVLSTASLGLQHNAERSQLLEEYHEGILQVSAADLQEQWWKATNSWCLVRWWQQRKIKNDLLVQAKTAQLTIEKVPELLEKLVAYQRREAQLLQQENWLMPLLGDRWKHTHTSWGELAAAVQVLQRTFNIGTYVLSDVQQLRAWRDRLGKMLAEGVTSYSNLHQSFWDECSRQFTAVLCGEERLKPLLNWKEPASADDEHWISASKNLFASVLQHLPSLRDWCLYRQCAAELTETGMGAAVDALDNGGLPVVGFTDSVKKGLFKSIADYQIDHSNALCKFSSDLFDERIKRYTFLMQQIEQISRKAIVARVSSRLPNVMQEAAKGSEVSILKRAISNNGRGISIRQLFQQVPHLLPRITPCMLMSPISVAQYLSLDLEPFDLIIFDEASQMPTAEAVGALARGRHVVVVGDPKQMPPTSFFATQQFDEDNADKEDLESILDDCLALPMPGKHLLWHYRSRHESLIAFSNAKYYDHQLLTFPSADDIETKVQYIPVDGYYDRSRARHNKSEAQAVVAEIIRRLKDPGHRQRSLGVVTFSSVQQLLIQDLMDEAFAAEPSLENLAMEREEPLFIKNLENVQGDERDVILFSVGYGPDKEGKLYMNFGPINREGGWRRLNVAVSRARYEMKVFSTLRGAQIDLTRTSSEGVAGLKAFLEYAEKGKTALPGAMHRVFKQADNFEQAIANFIADMGYDVHTHVGTSGFKVDIAVLHPQEKGKYLLGVLCDGKQFASIPAARDRFIGKVEVLQQLGWRIHRIWAADWWLRPGKERQKLEQALKAAKENSPEADIANLLPETQSPIETVAATAAIQNHAPVATSLAFRQPYTPACLPAVQNLNYIDFLEFNQLPLIARQLQQVLQLEVPITKGLLYQRVLKAWGISRLGVRIEEQLDAALATLSVETVRFKGQQEVLLPAAFDIKNYRLYRAFDPQSATEKRSPEDIPILEIANAMHDLVAQQISLQSNELLRETARLFGFARMGLNVEQFMKAGLEYGLESGIVVDRNGRVLAGKR